MGTRIKNGWLLLKCIAYRALKGRMVRPPAQVKNILFVYTVTNLGDMVCATPVFRACKEKYPNASIAVVGRSKGREVLAYNPDVDHYEVTASSALPLLSWIKSRRFDFAATLAPSVEDLSALCLSGIPSISAVTLEGESFRFSRAYTFLTRFVHVAPLSIGAYVQEQFLKLLTPLGIENGEALMRLGHSPESAQKVASERATLGSSLRVGLAPGGAAKVRCWPPERYAAIANYAFERYGATIMLLGAGSDKEQFEEVRKYAKPNVPILDKLNQSIDEFKAQIADLSVLISNDSAPAVIAEAYDTPSILVAGPADEREHHVFSDRHRLAISPTRGKPATHMAKYNDYDEEEAWRQINEVTVDIVKRELDTLLSTPGIGA